MRSSRRIYKSLSRMYRLPSLSLISALAEKRIRRTRDMQISERLAQDCDRQQDVPVPTSGQNGARAVGVRWERFVLGHERRLLLFAFFGACAVLLIVAGIKLTEALLQPFGQLFVDYVDTGVAHAAFFVGDFIRCDFLLDRHHNRIIATLMYA